jgi:diguanylate cyclase (GGDEF)-like protein/PAS domain S-box-containing protein
MDEHGKVCRVIGTVQDTTERKLAEEALRENEEKYRMVADFTYDWEAWHSPNGIYLYVSPSCERITGYKADEFIADADLLVNITHPDDRANIVAHLQMTTSQPRQRDASFDFRIITKSGEARWINHTCTAVYDSKGKWMGRRESNRDVTARRQSDAVLRSRLRFSQFADSHTADDVLQYTLNEAEALTESQVAFFHALDTDQNMLTLQMWSTNTMQGLCAVERENLHHSIDKAGVWADCVHKREPVIHNDYLKLSRCKDLPPGHASVQRILAVPIFHNDLIVAVVGVGNKPQEYDHQDIKTVQQIADLAWDVIQRKRSEDEVRRTKDALEAANRELQIALEREKELSHTDSLTGIHNRRYLFELAEREVNIATRHSLPLSVIMFDVDFFKKINDTFGHDIGDAVLQRVIETSRLELRSSDVIGRYGGEEFVVILPMTTAAQALPVAERIRVRVEVLRVPTHTQDAAVTLSIGIAELPALPDKTASVDHLVRWADEAMYAAKQAGRNRIALHGENHAG